jgi:hypothetical protein
MCIGLRFGPMVGSDPGVACPKCWRSGCEPATLETEPFPFCPPGPPCSSLSVALGVGDQVGEDGITDAPLEATQRFFIGLAFF